MRVPFFVVLFFVVATAIQGQSTCKAHRLTEAYLQAQGETSALQRALNNVPKGMHTSRSTNTIPLVFHVVWNTFAENVPDQVILNIVDQVNADFSATNTDLVDVRSVFTNDIADANVQFCLADTDPNGAPTTGITRTQTNEIWFNPDTETNKMKSAPAGIAPWDPTSYLNVWICDITSGASGAAITVGYAFLPVSGIVGSSIDGVVIDFDQGTGNNVRTTTHEIGHYLGLQHTWGAGGCVNDDGFTDTPNTISATPSCTNPGLITCTTLVQYENFMDLSTCGSMYTHEQAAYMNSVLTGIRSSLLSSNGCAGVVMGVPTATLSTTTWFQHGQFLVINGIG